jgi:hypothetical protein
MLFTYGPGVTRTVAIPAPGAWLASTPANDGHWYSRTVRRSAPLQRLDAALLAFNGVPGLQNFTNLENAYNAWHGTKVNCFGNFSSRRAAATNPLEAALITHRQWLNDAATVMARVEAGLGALNWKNNILCAELYRRERDVRWAPLQQRDIFAIASEQVLTSGWVHPPGPPDVAAWSAVGAAERQRLAQWPHLNAGIHDRMRRVTGIDPGDPTQWPPWQHRLPAAPAPDVPFVRKGLFCHSCAALAVEYLYANRAALVLGTHYTIHSIDVIHQQPAADDPTRTSHWWVCVNGPAQITYFPGGAVANFPDWQSFVTHLPITGGFVVDIWGSLWADQEPDRFARARNAAATAGPCVIPVPDDFLDNTPTISRAREVW